jgi:hypothetical protein
VIVTENSKLIIVRQLPVIEEHLKSLNEEITLKVSEAMELDCNEDTYKQIKKIRADLNKESKQLEDQRKAVKNAVLKPYNDFESVYKRYISEIYSSADTDLKNKIAAVEDAIKSEKKTELLLFVNEYIQSKSLDFLTFEKMGITISMTASLTNLKKQAKAFVDKVVEDIGLIDTQEHKAEILVEYKKSLNVSNAITSVVERHKAIEKENQRAEQLMKEAEQRVAAEQKVNEAVLLNDDSLPPFEVIPISAPVSVPAPEVDTAEKYEVSFKILGTLERLRALKKFLTDGGYEYEQF